MTVQPPPPPPTTTAAAGAATSPHQAKPMQSSQGTTNKRFPLPPQKLQSPNLLLTSPSPRKIKPFERKFEALNQKYDTFIVKHDFDEINAYRTIRNFFLDHKEYTHMALIPDDLLVDIHHVDKLVEDITGKGFNDYPVISGVCNFACTTKKFFNNMAMIEYGKIDALAQLQKTGRYDYFKHITSRERYNQLKENMKDKPNRIIRVVFSAFPLTVIRRDVMEKIEFGMNLMGVDTVFFQSCIKEGIPTYADLDVQTLHLMGIERNRDIDYLINMAFKDNIDTKVIYIKSKPPERKEIFTPKVH